MTMNRRVVDKRSGKVLHSGTLKSCQGYMWGLYVDDSSDDGLYVWCEIY